MTRRALLAALFAAFGLSLGACGRRGSPTPPEDADPKVPRRYPIR